MVLIPVVIIFYYYSFHKIRFLICDLVVLSEEDVVLKMSDWIF